MSKKAKRLQQTERHIERQANIASLYMNNPTKQKHRYHKKKAMNCGQPNCVICGNPRKFFGEKTMQERRFECLVEDDPRNGNWIGKWEWEDLNDPNMDWNGGRDVCDY